MSVREWAKRKVVWRRILKKIWAVFLISVLLSQNFSLHVKAASAVSLESSITYAEFIAMLVEKFYPDRLVKEYINENEEWFVPYLRVACERGILTNTLNASIEYGNHAIYRYDVAQILVKLLEDKCVVLPEGQQLDAASVKIADWNKVEEDKYWKYYVACAYAMGIFEGMSGWESFQGAKYITRAEANELCARVDAMVEAGKNDIRAFRIIFEGNWDAITVPGYKESIEKEFYTVYPRLWARWGDASVPKIIHVYAKSQAEMGTAVGLKDAAYDEEQRRMYPYVSISIEFANQYPKDRFFSHEMTHVVQNYLDFNSTWWVENMAGYGRFRYCAWADKEFMDAFDFHRMPDASLLDWEYKADDKCHWFFAYMDNRYPTTEQHYGLIDSIHWAIRRGELKSDGGADQSDETLNKIIQQVTGYENIEELRLQYRQELENGTWTFNGFYGYADNVLTENLPDVKNPSYPTIQELETYFMDLE